MFRNVNIEKEFCTAAPIKGSFGQVKVKCDLLVSNFLNVAKNAFRFFFQVMCEVTQLLVMYFV